MTKKKTIRKSLPAKQLIGWREVVSLPDFNLSSLKAKTDTGARTTALHASNIVSFDIDGEPWVKFIPNHHDEKVRKVCKALVLHTRSITNTSGIPEKRFIIATRLRIGELEHRIEISLADRSGMKFPVILGRTTLRVFRLNVNPTRSWLLSDNITSKTKRKPEAP